MLIRCMKLGLLIKNALLLQEYFQRRTFSFSALFLLPCFCLGLSEHSTGALRAFPAQPIQGTEMFDESSTVGGTHIPGAVIPTHGTASLHSFGIICLRAACRTVFRRCPCETQVPRNTFCNCKEREALQGAENEPRFYTMQLNEVCSFRINP